MGITGACWHGLTFLWLPWQRQTHANEGERNPDNDPSPPTGRKRPRRLMNSARRGASPGRCFVADGGRDRFTRAGFFEASAAAAKAHLIRG